MNWVRINRRSAWIIGLTLLVPLILYLHALFGLWGIRQAYQAQIDDLQPRIARLRGLQAYEGELAAAVGAVDSKVVDLVYPASADRATVATTLQKDVRQILVEAGLTVSNSQILAVREEDAFDYIGLKLTATGDIAALDAALSAIAGYLPVLLVEELDIWPQRTGSRGGEAQQQELSVSLQLLSLRASQ